MDWDTGAKKEEREGGDLREELKNRTIFTYDALWPWSKTTSRMRKESLR